ncbi:MAG: Brix domain-containing protein [Candidatus Heimdallarchaeota archaeon]|nr:Brix domain-containing protein [Candidatus Heimdallarchaeota archaeon]
MSKIGFTTSRSPAKKTRSFIHDLVSIVPQSSRVARGSATLLYTISAMKTKKFETAVIIHSVKGNPNFIRIYDLAEEPEELPFAIKVRGLTLSREYVKDKERARPVFSILISSLDNSHENEILKRVFRITNMGIDKIKDKNYVTLYADYLDRDEGLIFLEFLDKNNKQAGPRMKIRIVPREVEQTTKSESK